MGFFECLGMLIIPRNSVKFRLLVDSNPSLSATQSELQRKSALLPPKYAEIAHISRLCRDKPDCRERTVRNVGHRFTRFSLKPQ
jgi:hypothetical protein